MYNEMYNHIYNIKKAKVSKIGDSFFFRIPKQYINNEEIDPNKEYNLEVKEAKK